MKKSVLTAITIVTFGISACTNSNTVKTEKVYHSPEDVDWEKEICKILSNGDTSIVQEYNEQNQLIKTDEYSNGNLTLEKTYTYDSLNNMICERKMFVKDSKKALIKYGYDKQNRITSRTYLENETKESSTAKYEYNGNKKTESLKIASSAQPIVKNYYSDENGNDTLIQSVSDPGIMCELQKMEYVTVNGKNKLKAVHKMKYKGEQAPWLTSSTTYDYDENGNVTQIKIEHPEDGLISSDEFEYDKYNRIIKHKTINKDFAANALIENIETYTYDQNCRIANTGEKTFFMFK
ncbi:MAG: hypothetical protein IKQ46_04360 [Bacteroidales bacterium]|nr:hypothetical protein [Bacteroidales bacterium]